MQDTNDDTFDVQHEWSRFLDDGVGEGSNRVSRRTVMRSGAIATGVVLGGSALAGNTAANRGNNYGNGNAIGAWLNEEAMFKESPVWDTGVADETGQDEVDVLFGGLTDVVFPGMEEPVPAPWGMDPRAVEVSPGTDVTWTWWEGNDDFEAIPAHHLVSYFDPPYEEEFELPWEDDGHGHEHPGGEDEFYVHEALGDTYTYTFDEPGIYLYFCIPHGTPFSFEFRDPESGQVFEAENLFGQRGAVIVTDD